MRVAGNLDFFDHDIYVFLIYAVMQQLWLFKRLHL